MGHRLGWKQRKKTERNRIEDKEANVKRKINIQKDVEINKQKVNRNDYRWKNKEKEAENNIDGRLQVRRYFLVIRK